MGWNELSDPDMRTANFEFSCDVYREGVYSMCVRFQYNYKVIIASLIQLSMSKISCVNVLQTTQDCYLIKLLFLLLF